MIHRALAALCLLALCAGCPSPTTAQADPTPDDGDAVAADPTPATRVEVGDWSTYAEPEAEEWPVEPLDDGRWATVSAELACAARANHGDPDAQRQASRRILARHKTTGEAVMEHGIAVNGERGRSHRLGEVVAAATEACR